MNQAASREFRCPTCRARQAPAETCRRCKCDLSLVLAARQSYEERRARCLTEIRAGRFVRAMEHARRCAELRPGREALRLVAVSGLAGGDWPHAALAAERLLASD